MFEREIDTMLSLQYRLACLQIKIFVKISLYFKLFDLQI